MDNNTAENESSSLRLLGGDSLPLEEILHIILRHRWLILLNTILFLTAAFLYLLKATPVYTSSSRLYVEQNGPKIINEYEGVMTQSNNYLYTQAELMKSTPIVANVVDDPQIQQFRTFAGIDNPVAYVKNTLDVTLGKKDDIITVSFDSPYPAEASQLVNAVVNSYVDYHRTHKRSTVSQVMNILGKEKVKREKELSDKFKELLEFTRQNGVVSSDEKGGHIVFERLTKLSGALTEAQLATINAKADFEAAMGMANEPSKIKQFASASPTTGIRVSVNDEESRLLSELRDAEVKLKNVKYHCTENHPSIRAIHDKIDHIRSQLDKEAKEFADAYIEVMRLRWITAKQREEELETSFERQRELAQDLGIKATEYSVLQSELKRTERLCDILDDRIKELSVTEDVGALNISILEVARPADSPSTPEKAKSMALALALGLMFGGGLALLRNWLDYRLRSADEISAVLGVPILGVIPTMLEGQTIATHSYKLWLKVSSAAAEFYRAIQSGVFSKIHLGKAKTEKQTLMVRAAAYRAKRSSQFVGVSTTKAKPAVISLASVGEGKTMLEEHRIVARGQNVFLKSKSVAAEAYRTLRTALFFGAPKDEAKTILVTSPAPGDGKSTLVSNLAIAMAQAGQKTLVLDGDFRRPMQNKIFEIDQSKGLSSVLAGRNSMDEVIVSGPVKGLDVLCCGPEVPNPSEILNSDTFARTLKSLCEQYDRIIIDSPPVGPVADSQILAALCDVVLLVLRAEKSTRRHSQQARDNLLNVGAHLLGAVVNDVPRKHGHYGYYSSYGSYSYYGYYGKRERKTG
jgi:capsular exopolysaccharide synthesis family protein